VPICARKAAPILELRTGWWRVVKVIPWLLDLCEWIPLSFEYEAGGAPEHVWTFWGRKQSLADIGFWTTLSSQWASHSSDWAIQALVIWNAGLKTENIFVCLKAANLSMKHWFYFFWATLHVFVPRRCYTTYWVWTLDGHLETVRRKAPCHRTGMGGRIPKIQAVSGI